MNRDALFSDETAFFRIPEEPDPGDTVTLKFRTLEDDADSVTLRYFDGSGIEMDKSHFEGFFDWYETRITVDEKEVSFYFEIKSGGERVYYDRSGITDTPAPYRAFRILPGFHVPSWAKGSVMYQIFVDRFNNGDPSNDVVSGEYIYTGVPVRKADDWNSLPETYDVARFYGGDIKGVWDKLDYLKGLGVEVIYLNPVFVSPSNHKYDCQDYDHIDPHYGVIVKDDIGLVSDEGFVPGKENASDVDAGKYRVRTTSPENLEASDAFFAEFVEAVHAQGMRIILDGVFNHCGSFNKWLDREKIYLKNDTSDTCEIPDAGAYISPRSRYRNYFRFADADGWPDNGSYEQWWGNNTLPKLNYDDTPELAEYIRGIAKKWLSAPYNADGWRLDVAADLGHSGEYNHEFWQEFRKAVKESNPDALILAEHYGDASAWLGGREWDSFMNYDAFMEPVSWFLTGMEKHGDRKDEGLRCNSEEFFRRMNENMCRIPTQSLYAAMNELSNHDHSRFLTRTNGMTGRLGSLGSMAASEGTRMDIFMDAVVIQMTWPGAPTIYYGDEAQMYGFTDPDNRRTYPWGHENHELIDFHSYITGIRREYTVFRTGSIKFLYGADGVIAYGRFDGTERAVVAVNSTDADRTADIPVWLTGENGEGMLRIMETFDGKYDADVVWSPIARGMMSVCLSPASSAIFVSCQTT